MANATFGPQGKIRAVERIKSAEGPKILRMNTFPFSGGLVPDPVMSRTITWDANTDYTMTTNGLPVKTATENSEYAGALLFPIAAGRRFSNMTLHFAGAAYPLALTFVLDGSESSTVSNYGGAAKLIGRITFTFGGF